VFAVAGGFGAISGCRSFFPVVGRGLPGLIACGPAGWRFAAPSGRRRSGPDLGKPCFLIAPDQLAALALEKRDRPVCGWIESCF
jgi:hypothetical protein